MISFVSIGGIYLPRLIFSCALGCMHGVKLCRYRNTHGVSLEEHHALLKQRGWTSEEYEAGFLQGVAPREGSEHFIQYEALVRRELASGEVRETKGMQTDRTKRARATFVWYFYILFLSSEGLTDERDESFATGRWCLLQLVRRVAETARPLWRSIHTIQIVE